MIDFKQNQFFGEGRMHKSVLIGMLVSLTIFLIACFVWDASSGNSYQAAADFAGIVICGMAAGFFNKALV